jgi:hypothetical protein
MRGIVLEPRFPQAKIHRHLLELRKKAGCCGFLRVLSHRFAIERDSIFPSSMTKINRWADLPVDSHPRQRCKSRSRLVFLRLLGASLFFTAATTDAGTITVTNGGDNGPGTLRQAIADAVPGDTINFAADITAINLTSVELLINKNLTISGPGAKLLIIQRAANASSAFRIFNIAAGNFNVAISGLTIASGVNFQSPGGGGLLINSGNTVTITNITVSGNQSGDYTPLPGGGIHNLGTVAITNSTVSGNTSSHGAGGGIFNSAAMTITNSTLSGNRTDFAPGAGICNNGTITITNSTISGNSARDQSAGGGIYNGGTVTLVNSTVCRNSAYGGIPGGGGMGIYNQGGTVNAKNSIIAANADGGGFEWDFGGTLTSQGYNLIGSNFGMTVTPMTGDQVGTNDSHLDPMVGPLQDNGGPTFTHGLLNGSPAIDKGGGGTGITTDQRGRPRPVRFDASIPEPAGGDGSDIGAFEVSPIQFDAPNYSVAENGGSAIVSVSRSGDTSQSASVHYATSDGTATAGLDYTSAVGDLVFASGETNKTITIQVFDDNIYEGDEAFTLTLSSSVGADLGLSASVVTIVDNDAPPASPTPTPTATPTSTPSPSSTPAARSLNISTRAQVGTRDNVTIGGFIVTGNTSKQVIIRAIGPSLKNSGLTGVVADPVLELRGPSGSLIASNDNWRENPDQALQIQASGFAPQDDLESAIVATLPPAGYTATMGGKSNGTGLGLVEVYDLDQGTDSELANISTRALVGIGDNVVIGGFILGGGNGNPSIIIRALGPSLARSGVSNPLTDPLLELRDGNGTLIAFDDNWKDNPGQAAQLVQAGVQPQNDLEAAIAAILPPGGYTAIVSGKNGGVGVGLVEVYNLQ